MFQNFVVINSIVYNRDHTAYLKLLLKFFYFNFFFFKFIFFHFFKKLFSETFNDDWELSHKHPIARSTSEELHFKSKS